MYTPVPWISEEQLVKEKDVPRISVNFREFPVILSSSVREWYLRIGVGTREVDLATEKATKQSATFSLNCPRTASSKKQTYSKEDKPLLQATNKLAIDANYTKTQQLHQLQQEQTPNTVMQYVIPSFFTIPLISFTKV